MRKSKAISLVLVTASLASCQDEPKKQNGWNNANDAYVRSDTSAPYYPYRTHSSVYMYPYYFAYRPYGVFYGGSYHHVGYYSSATPERCNIGRSSFKSNVVRGGFGRSGSYSVSS
jgi:hypothetical protein